MSITEQQINYIANAFPETKGNNTEFCIKFWETACEQHGIEFPEDVKWAIRQYKPEAITRKRREFIKSTSEQRDKEVEHMIEYTRYDLSTP